MTIGKTHLRLSYVSDREMIQNINNFREAYAFDFQMAQNLDHVLKFKWLNIQSVQYLVFSFKWNFEPSQIFALILCHFTRIIHPSMTLFQSIIILSFYESFPKIRTTKQMYEVGFDSILGTQNPPLSSAKK